jgi:hypothetical protein
MPTKHRILASLAAVARSLRRTPSRSEFISLSGISEYYISLFFPTWNHAVKGARLRQRPPNLPIESAELLRDWGEVVRRGRTLPSRRVYRREGKYDLRTIERRFARWSAIPRVFGNFAEGKPEWADVVALLPSASPMQIRAPQKSDSASPPGTQQQHRPLKGKATYGNPIDFRGLRHEPVNEQGVVLLFGMLAKELGYIIEAVQNGFPDCEAKRRVSPHRWQRIQIEFEFESRSFRDHGHSATGCDVIVCWHHNWPECPQHIEVLELSGLVKSQVLRDDGSRKQAVCHSERSEEPRPSS